MLIVEDHDEHARRSLSARDRERQDRSDRGQTVSPRPHAILPRRRESRGIVRRPSICIMELPMRMRPTEMTPAAQRIRDILRDPPRAGWTRRTFLTRPRRGRRPCRYSPPRARWLRTGAPQAVAGRIKITDVRLQRLRLEKSWGTSEDYVGNRRGGRTGWGRDHRDRDRPGSRSGLGRA